MDLNEAHRVLEIAGTELASAEGVAHTWTNETALAVRAYVAGDNVTRVPLVSDARLPHDGAGLMSIEEEDYTYEAQPCPMCLATGTMPDHPRYGRHAGDECAACFATGWIPTVKECRRTAQRTAALLLTVRHAIADLEPIVTRGEAGQIPSRAMLVRDSDGASNMLDNLDDPLQRVRWLQVLGEASRQLQEYRDLEEALEDAAVSNQRRLESTSRLRQRLRRLVHAWDRAAEAQAVVDAAEAATAPTKAPQCRTPGCHKQPQVWDAEARGWCRRHAHRRGLLQREAVPEPEA